MPTNIYDGGLPLHACIYCGGKPHSDGAICPALLDGSINGFLSTNSPVSHPAHYTSHPSGIECIQITEHMGFNLGNAMKYIWRADLKNDAIEDMEKAIWYINREIAKRKKGE